MANSLFCRILGVLLVIFLGHVHNPLSQAYAVSEETWCVAKPSSSSGTLENAESYACSFVDCSLLHTENPCFSSNLFIRASFAMNAYYRHYHVCDFAGFGIKSIINPSYGNCNSFVASKETTPAPAAMKWCIAKPTTPSSLLQMNFNLACSQVNCSVFQTGGDCQSVNTTMNRASFAMNLLYQASDRTDSSCFFNSTGMIVIDDPSHGTCIYGSKRQEGHGSDHISAPATPTPPESFKKKAGKSSVKLKIVVPVGTIFSLLFFCASCVCWRKRAPVTQIASVQMPTAAQSQHQPQSQPQPQPLCSFSFPFVVNICSM